MKKITVQATIENLDRVLNFVNDEIEITDCPPKTAAQLAVAVEEIFVNIAHYAYGDKTGEATIECAVGGEPLKVEIRFLDHGVPYNPLEHRDPDVGLSAEERGVGGLGIYMVKKSMDSVDYAFERGKNVLTIRKTIG